ncbi:MAG: hypothetical protein M1831_003220 [Alyxoria varia]|nr:MAG: hypothetical protein M1831_003220 [Alyxoria varia]
MAGRPTDNAEIVPPYDGFLCKEAADEAAKLPSASSFFKLFAPECPICRDELSKMQAKYADKKKPDEGSGEKKPSVVPDLSNEFLIFPMDHVGRETGSPPAKFTTITSEGEVKGKEKAGDAPLPNQPINMSNLLPIGSQDYQGHTICYRHHSACICPVDDATLFKRIYGRSPSPPPTAQGRELRAQTHETVRQWQLHRSGQLGKEIDEKTKKRVQEWLPPSQWNKRF